MESLIFTSDSCALLQRLVIFLGERFEKGLRALKLDLHHHRLVRLGGGVRLVLLLSVAV